MASKEAAVEAWPAMVVDAAVAGVDEVIVDVGGFHMGGTGQFGEGC